MSAGNELLQLREVLRASLSLPLPSLGYVRAPIARDAAAVAVRLAAAASFESLPQPDAGARYGCAAPGVAYFRRPSIVLVRRRRSRVMLNHISFLMALASSGGAVSIFDEEDLPSHTASLELFARADVIVGAHGAGLTNIFLTAPGGAVFEVLASNFAGLHYAEFSVLMGAEYHRWEVPPQWPEGFDTSKPNAEKLANVMMPTAELMGELCGFLRRRFGVSRADWQNAQARRGLGAHNSSDASARG